MADVNTKYPGVRVTNSVTNPSSVELIVMVLIPGSAVCATFVQPVPYGEDVQVGNMNVTVG